MSKNLLIVESPHKAKTIEKFLGADYRVLSSQGHIRDIEGKGKNSMGIDFEHDYKPNYVIDPQKTHIIEALRSEVNKADTVYLASDADREGEAIAWHLKEVLNLKNKDVKRIVFHEITKTAIQQALQAPRDIDYNLVNAQQARRVLDRIVGFELSPILWKKVTTGLSAGRVQSVAVRMIVEREREIENFKTSYQYRICADFTGQNPSDATILKTELNHRFATKEEAELFLQECAKASFKIESVQKKSGKHTPAPPFMTSTLQEEAARKLKFPVSKTMRLAQALYEAGHITYMRTDSLNLSSLAIATAKKEIEKEYGVRYHQARQYHTSAKGAQEAHEAIRPTYMNVHSAGDTADEKHLYELIWKRTMACQMADAEVESTRIEVAISNSDFRFVASGETVVFDGFMRAYVQSTDDEQDNETRVLPQMALNESLRYIEVQAIQTFVKAPLRYNDASLVHKMKELRIGRPSTYAAIVETILSRKYVERGSVLGKKRDYQLLTLKSGKITNRVKQETYGSDLQKLLPTDLGRMTNDFLVEQFPAILSYEFTAQEEDYFDSIAAGKTNWVKTVDDFYKTFHPLITHVPAGKVATRELGVNPATGERIFVKISKLGPCVQMGDSDDVKPRFASLRKNQSIYTITLEDALQLFQNALPYTLGEMEGKEIVVGEGKYGPYVRWNGTFISIPKNQDPLTLTMEDVKSLIENKSRQDEPLRVFGDIQIINGRYGYYLKTTNGNYKLPRTTDVATLTEETCRTIIEKEKKDNQGKEKTVFRKKNKK